MQKLLLSGHSIVESLCRAGPGQDLKYRDCPDQIGTVGNYARAVLSEDCTVCIASMLARFGPGRAGAFREPKSWSRIELSEKNSVAERVGDWDGGIVFTAQPIAVDTLYQVELLKRESRWPGCLVSVGRAGGALIFALKYYTHPLTCHCVPPHNDRVLV